MKTIIISTTLALFMTLSAHAQECSPSTGDGPVDQQKSAVKKVADQVTLNWTAPQFLQDCTPISDDPSFAITQYHVYVSLDAPADNGMPPIDLPASQTTLTINVDSTSGVGPGSRLYYAIAARNEYGVSFLSNQPWVQVGGPPGRSEASAQ